MRYLPDFDLQSYGANGKKDYMKPLDALIRDIELENDPTAFRNLFLAVAQLYVDYLLDGGGLLRRIIRKIDSYSVAEEKQIMDDITNAGIKFIGGYYCGNPDIESAREAVLFHASSLAGTGYKKEAKFKLLDKQQADVQQFGIEFQNAFQSIHIDTVVPIASGGIEPAFLALYLLKKNAEDTKPIRYSYRSESYRKPDKIVKVPSCYEKDIRRSLEGKVVLVVEDQSIFAISLMNVIGLAEKMDAREIYGAAVSARTKQIIKMNYTLLSANCNAFIFYFNGFNYPNSK